MPLRVLGVVYWPVRNLFSSVHSLSYLGSNCHPIIQDKGYNVCGSTLLVSRVSHPLSIRLTSSLPVLVPPSEPLVIFSLVT
jgi:hypothetical protein